MPALSFPDLQRKLKGNAKPSQQQPLDAASQGGQEERPDAPDAKPPTPSAKDLRSVAGASPDHARVTALYHQAKAKQNAKQHAASQQPDQIPPGDPSAQQDTAGVAGTPPAGQRLSPDSPLPGASPVPHPDDDGSTGGEPVPELGHPVSQDPLYDKKTGQPLKSDAEHEAEEAAEQQAAGMGGNAPPGAAGLNGGAMVPPMVPPGMENAAAGQQMAPGMAAMGPEGLPPQPAHLPDFPHTMAAAAYLEAYRAHQQAAGRPFIASQVLADHERHVADALKQGHHVPPDVLADYAHLQPPHEHQKMALGMMPMPGAMSGVPGAGGQMPPGLEGAGAQTPGAPSPATAAPGMAPGGQPPEGLPEEEAGETPEEEAQEQQGGDGFFRSDEMKNMSPDQLSQKLGVGGGAEPGDEEQPGGQSEGMPPAEEGMPGEQSPATQGGFTPPSQKQREGEGLEEPPPQPDKFHSGSDEPEGAEAEDKPEHTPAEGGEPAAEGKEPRNQLAPKRPYDELLEKLKNRKGQKNGVAFSADSGEDGVWRTIHGAHVFIKHGKIEKGPSHMVGRAEHEVKSKPSYAPRVALKLAPWHEFHYVFGGHPGKTQEINSDKQRVRSALQAAGFKVLDPAKDYRHTPTESSGPGATRYWKVIETYTHPKTGQRLTVIIPMMGGQGMDTSESSLEKLKIREEEPVPPASS